MKLNIIINVFMFIVFFKNPNLLFAKEENARKAFLVACGDQHVEKSLNLPKAVEDMDKFRESLLRTGFKSEDIVYLQGKAGVELRYQPTKLAILEELSLVIKGLNVGDTLVVALNGHGIHPKGAKTSYFVPLDGRIEKEKTLLAMDGEESMFGMLREAVRKKARVLLVVGACRNAINGNVQALNQMDLEDPSVPPEGIAAIYSCGVGQKTYFDAKGGSYFYEHLSKAWLGEYHPEEEKISLELVFKAVSEKTFRDVSLLHNADQKPEMRREYKGEWSIFQNDISIRKDFEIIMRHYNNGLKYIFLTNLNEIAPGKINGWKKSSRANSPEGLWIYAVCLKNGVLVNTDEKMAFELFKKSTELGCLPAMTELGRCYLDGFGVEENTEEAIKWFRKAADKNCSEAMKELSICYRDGKFVSKNKNTAFAWVQKSAELGNKWSLAELGTYYDDGKVVNEDKKEAFKLYTKAADAGEIFAMAKLGEFYLDGIVVKKDEKMGFDLIFKATRNEKVDGFSFALLGDCFRYGKGVEKNEKEAFNSYQEGANLNNINCINSLADCCINGIGKTKETKTGFNLYEKSASMGSRNGNYELANCYFYGIGCEKDNSKAFEYYQKAGDLGSASALNLLGYSFFSKGVVVDKDLEKAFEYYEKAANLGNKPAMINLFYSYLEGKGVNKDEKKAFYWCNKAADLGFSIGLNNLGYYFYRTGLVVPRDGYKAFDLYMKAAEKGETAAMVNLGASYEDGFGAPRNLSKAIYWYRQAASKGRIEGKNALNRLGYSE